MKGKNGIQELFLKFLIIKMIMLLIKNIKFGLRLYAEKFIENRDYDYYTFLAYADFWIIIIILMIIKEIIIMEIMNIMMRKFLFIQKKFQIFHNYYLIHKETLSNLSNQYNQFYNSSNSKSNNIKMQTQDNSSEKKTKNMTDKLYYEKYCLDEDGKYFKYFYQKDYKKIIFLEKS